MARKHVVAGLAAALVVGVTAFTSSAASKPARLAGDDPNNASLTYWYWGEDDAPGANGWLKQQVALYQKAHPKVKITIVTQSTDTLTSAFTTAAQTKSGPDIATQWATLPVLTPAWTGASVPISDYVLADLKKKGYLNSDVASISFTQGLQLFGQKKVAMSWVTDGNAAAAGKALGGTKGMGVGPIPVWGKGKLATSYDTTQSSSAFITKWSKHPRAAAQFLMFLHSPQALKAWYKATGVFPADKRFPASLVTDPIAKQQLALDKSRVSVWP